MEDAGNSDGVELKIVEAFVFWKESSKALAHCKNKAVKRICSIFLQIRNFTQRDYISHFAVPLKKLSEIEKNPPVVLIQRERRTQTGNSDLERTVVEVSKHSRQNSGRKRIALI